MRIALATCAALLDLGADDRLLADALRARGCEVVPAVWSDAAVRWGSFDRVVIRSVWDYHRRFAEFTAWLDRLEDASAVVLNPLRTLRWNVRKGTYLAELAAAGAVVVPTELLEPTPAAPSLAGLLDRRGWSSAVLKPEVSASAHLTLRTTRADAEAHQADLQRMLDRGAALVQPYLPGVERGEWSLVHLGGTFSHAVRKRPAPGDFRVQEEHGGTTRREPPPAAFLAHAARVLRACPHPWTYARVDAVEHEGEPLLMELELVEPLLFLAHEPQAPGRLADAILAAQVSAAH